LPPSFAGPKDYATEVGPESVAIGDLNGDGKPDLAVANYESNTVSVLTNRRGGNFRRRDYRTGASPNDVAIGDLNGDGRADLALANNDASSVSVLTNRGGGNFRRRDYRAGESPDRSASPTLLATESWIWRS